MAALFTPAAESVIDRLRERAEREEAVKNAGGPALMARRDEFLLPIGDDAGEVIASLIIARKAQCIVEVGTSYGFSTLYLASAAARTGGTLHTLEIADYKQAHARAALEEAGLSAHVQWHLGDAVQLIHTLPDQIDFVLIDLWKDLYIPCLDAIAPKLAPGAIVTADNMIIPAEHHAQAEAYRAHVRRLGFESVLLPIGEGIEVSCRP